MSKYFFDRQGNNISLEEFDDVMSQDRRVAETTLKDGLWVSTVFLSVDHNYGNGIPLIFETLVFKEKDTGAKVLDTRRYSTEAEALAGHDEVCAEWEGKK